jgi:hypothetical protein
MNKALKISLYVAGGVSAVILANEVTKMVNSGKGFFTSDKQMAKFVGMSKFALNEPYTEEELPKFFEFWEGLGKAYRLAWYKAVWNSEKGKPQIYFYNTEGKRFLTKGGKAA